MFILNPWTSGPEFYRVSTSERIFSEEGFSAFTQRSGGVLHCFKNCAIAYRRELNLGLLKNLIENKHIHGDEYFDYRRPLEIIGLFEKEIA